MCVCIVCIAYTYICIYRHGNLFKICSNDLLESFTYDNLVFN